MILGTHITSITVTLCLRSLGTQLFVQQIASSKTLQWCHNEHGGVSNHRRLDCLLNYLFKCRSKKTSKLHITGLCEGNPTVTGGFPTQRASNTKNVSIWRSHHEQKKYQSSTLLAICDGNPSIIVGFPAKRDSNTESVSMASQGCETQSVCLSFSFRITDVCDFFIVCLICRGKLMHTSMQTRLELCYPAPIWFAN